LLNYHIDKSIYAQNIVSQIFMYAYVNYMCYVAYVKEREEGTKKIDEYTLKKWCI